MGITHHGGVFLLVVWKALDEGFHVKSVQLSIAFLLLVRPAEMLAIGVEETGQTADKSGPYSVGMEGLGANNGYLSQASAVGHRLTGGAFIETIAFRPVIADGANGQGVIGVETEAMALYPYRGFRVADRLDLHVGHDCGRSEGGLSVCGRRVAPPKG